MNQHLEILHGIVEAEKAARSDYEKALAKQVSFDSDVKAEIERLRQQYYAKTDGEIAEFEASEVKKADAEIAVLDSRLDAEMDKAKTSFEEKKEGYAQRIFQIVVNQNA